ncbi:large ribosomal subunit protein uL2m-like [Antedon mediterranea]|uniref:large ribosomal subunit protein uL2m-like n=1 Tax=Antedon mediterranea TaxID=105859 RepID=UPI003AF6500B
MSLPNLCRSLTKLSISNSTTFSAGLLCRANFTRETILITTQRKLNTLLPSTHFIKSSKSDINCFFGLTSIRQCSSSGSNVTSAGGDSSAISGSNVTSAGGDSSASLSWTTYGDGKFIYEPKKRPLSAKWRHRGLENKYTIRPIGFVRTSGRNHLGKITITGRGGGHKRNFRIIDFHRTPPMDGSVKEERVLKILYDPNRSARIALVAGGTHKRYILATINMKEGDIIKTSCQIGRMSVMANEGDAYPLAALPINAQVHCVETLPGSGGTYGRSAGTSLTLLRKVGGQAILKMPSKRQISVSDKCMATVGRLSNENHNQRVIGKAGRNRWLGWRPASGWWQRKGGWAGRKIKPIPPMKIFIDTKASNKSFT